MAVIDEVRNKQPLIHHLTNQVVMNFTANGLLAFGGAPVMAKETEEAADMAAIADGLLINIGTITKGELPAMIAAGKAANEKGIPVVLDPVGAAATPFRTDALKQILKQVRPTAIKGNVGEIAHLVDIPWETRGVDSLGEGDVETIARKAADQYGTMAIVTGKVDVICDGEKVLKNETGHPFLTKITGAGCLLGSVITACLAVEGDKIEQALEAVAFYGQAAVYAAETELVKGPGTFLPRFIDALTMDMETLERR
ncbi:hydroxyethylthiazole kinase [Thalassobacillus pellis]|uniref:hydroxyethylthiazole kinase n=1 Tax=Thalassobacillus pellis TaxID=748008 RepID=UPI00196110C7|nr:hydroxyethylthiazole kinase [Thalassobacillus pellis]MBM7552041.1 hydroxyethylthiazole kinase [Thalassobacillus pellis]